MCTNFYKILNLVKSSHNRLHMAHTSVHSLVSGFISHDNTNTMVQGQCQFQWRDFGQSMDMVFVSFIDGQKRQEKALEFRFHLRHCTPADLQV